MLARTTDNKHKERGRAISPFLFAIYSNVLQLLGACPICFGTDLTSGTTAGGRTLVSSLVQSFWTRDRNYYVGNHGKVIEMMHKNHTQ